MKFAWHERMSKASTACVALGVLVVVCGCQTWSPSNWGVPTSSRVPPPPTGSYQHQGAYYNNPSMGTPAAPGKTITQVMPNSSAPVVQASAVNAFGSNSSLPAMNTNDKASAFSAGATSIGFQRSSGQVTTAGYNDNGSGLAEVVTAGSLQSKANFDSGNTDSGNAGASGRTEVNSSTGEGASLQWTGK